MVFNKLGYSEHNWAIYVDFKMVNFLLGQQGGYTKYPFFVCYWDSRASTQHWVKKDWPAREDLAVGDKNIINEPLVSRDRIISPPLHIKLGLMKQIVEALDKHGDCFNYIVVIAPSFFILIICRCWASNTFIFPIFCSNQKKAFACSFCALYFALFFAVLENHFFTFLHGC